MNQRTRIGTNDVRLKKMDRRRPMRTQSIPRLVLLGLIINELISNAFKHADADIPQVSISIDSTILNRSSQT